MNEPQTNPARLAYQNVKTTRLQSPRIAQSARAGQRPERVICWHCERVKSAYAEIEGTTAENWNLKEQS